MCSAVVGCIRSRRRSSGSWSRRATRFESSSTAQISKQRDGLPGTPADHLGAPADLDERALQEIRSPDPLAVLGRPAQMRGERVEVGLDQCHDYGYAIR
jgi:hypothetical protein